VGKSRRASLIAAVIALVWSIAPPTGGVPVQAAVYNPIPADAAENPNDDFTENQSLWAWFTSDLAGGRICAVPATGSGSCGAPALGGPRIIASTIGTGFTLIKAAPLKPGTYRLLTENSLEEPIAYSIPFTVRSCDNGCHPNLDATIVKNFKDAAKDMQVRMMAECQLTGVLEKVAGKAIKLRGTEYGITASATVTASYSTSTFAVTGSLTISGGFTIQDPFTVGINKALDILKDVACNAQKMYQNIADDPADPNYGTVAPPAFSTIGPLLPAALDDAVRTVDDQRGYSEAILHAFERYQGAKAAGDEGAQIAQLNAASDNALLLSHELLHSAKTFRTWADQAALDPELSGVMLASADAPALASSYARVAAAGFSADEIDQFHALGYTDTQIAAFRTYATVGINDIPLDTTYPAALRAAADTFEAQVDAVADFAAETGAFAASIGDNAPPVASFTPSSFNPDAPVQVAFTSTATDPNGDPLTYTWNFGDGATATGVFAVHTFTTAGTYNVTLMVSDGEFTDTAARQIVVTGNHAPDAVDDAATTTVGSPVTISVLANDTDVDAQQLTISAFDAASGGGGTVSCAATCLYTPPPGVYGVDLFRYTVSDPSGAKDSATVRVTITNVTPPANDPPVANSDQADVDVGDEVDIDVLANDTDPENDDISITAFDATSALGGAVACTTTCHYVPPAGIYGTDVFTYIISDGQGGFAGAAVSVHIHPPAVPDNNPPVATDDEAFTNRNVVVTIDLLANDTDADDDPLGVIDVDATTAQGGTVQCIPHCNYAPPTNFVGTDQFSYTVTDGRDTDTATVTVHVAPALNGITTFTARPNRGFAALPVVFDASPSTATGIVSWQWDFGDGSTGAGEIASHTYQKPGQYEARLIATDGLGAAGTFQMTIFVFDQELLELPICGDQGTPGEDVVFQCADYLPSPGVQSFGLAGSGPVDVRFDFVYRGGGLGNELAVLTVDDAFGTIDGIAPGDEGWYRAAFERARTIFASGSFASVDDVTLPFEGGDRLVFMLLPSGTLADHLTRPDSTIANDVFFTIDRVNPDDQTRHVFGYHHTTDGSIEFGFEDLYGGGDFDFNDMVFTAHAAFRAVQPLTVTKTADAPNAEPGSQTGYEITVTNSLPASVAIDAITDLLPDGFEYVADTTTGATSADPTVNGQLLRWNGPLTIPGLGQVTLHFDVTVSDVEGTYYNQAGALSSVPASGTGPTAPITVSAGGGGGENRAPSFGTITNPTIDEQVAFTLPLPATDPDAGQTLTFSLVSGPPGLAVSGAGSLTWTPTEAQGPGSYPVTVRVVDNGTPSLGDQRLFTITVREVNRPPLLGAMTDITVHPGELAAVSPSASDPDLPANTLSYTLVDGPAGAAVNPTSGAFAWTPGAADLGDHDVTLGVGDGVGGSAQQSFTIHVVRDPTVLVLGGATTGQYSDRATITATLTSGGTPVSGATVTIGFGASTTSATTDASGVASTVVTLTGPSGGVSTSASFAGTPALAPTSTSGSFSISREDSVIVYSGTTIGLVGANLQLAATFTDSAAAGYGGPNPETVGATIGDITKARIAFSIWAAGTCMTGSPITTVSAAVVDTGTAGDGIGTATTTWSSSSEGTFCIVPSLVAASGTGANAHYAAPPAVAAGLAVYVDTAGKVTGGGWVSLGTDRANFGFNASSIKGRTKGNLVYVQRTVYAGQKAILIVKSNAIDTLRVTGTTLPVTVALSGKATFRYISASTGATLFESGNATFVATVIDTGKEGDAFGVRVVDKVGAVIADIATTPLGAGNIVAHIK
jgi:uncharacterized repeat protein (TIGR01451 family)